MTKQEEKPPWAQYFKYSQVGLETGLSVVAGALIGYWLDLVLGTEPYFLIFWMFCGAVAGFRTLYRMAKKWQEEQKDDPPSE